MPILMLAGMLAGCGGGGDGSANPPSPLTAPNITDASEQTAGDDATASGDSPSLASGDSLSNPHSPITPQISAGYDRTYAINSSGQLFGWGVNSENRLGLDDPSNLPFIISTPTLLTGNNWIQVSAGRDHTCAIDTSGQLFCWGDGDYGRLGLGNNSNTNTPTQVGGARNWIQVSAGRDHTCAIDTSGQLFCWGYNFDGRLGLGHNNNTNTPTQVGGDSGDSDWMQVSAGDHTCAIKASGQLWCWGFNQLGQLGLGNNDNDNNGFPDNVNVPVRVGEASDWVQVSGGRVHTCAIKAAGQLWCWGWGGHGQLGLGHNDNNGDGVPDNVNTPTQVGGASGDSDWVQVSAGGRHTCAIEASGQLWCWGRGTHGLLGLGHNNHTNTPTQVGGASGDSDWMQVNGGGDHTCAIKASGQLFCWGYNFNGLLGFVSSNTSVNTPTLVPGIDLRPGITVNPAAPSLQALDAQRYPTGVPVNVKLVNDGGGELTECTVNNTLPSGLSVARNTGNDSCEITGTPDTVTPAADFDITATNITGSSTITVSIAVVSGVASFAPFEALVYVVGESVNERFDNTNTSGRRVSACMPTETLPDGLSVAATAMPGNGCVLTGTPTTITAQAVYTVTVTNGGDAALTLDITVNPAAPNLQAPDAQRYPTGVPVSVELVNDGGGGLMECSVNSPLPNGLDVTTNADNDSCVIAGTPDTPMLATNYDITATNITGSDTVTVSIIVNSGIVPVSLSGQSLFRYEIGQTVSDTRQITFTNIGGSIRSCAAPDLPHGMSINSADCAISGKPSRITTKTTTHAITATYTDDTTSVTMISIETYVSAPPSLSDYSSVSLVVGSFVGLPIILKNTGGLIGENGCQVTSDNAGGERPLSNFGLELAVANGGRSCEIRGVNKAPTATVEKTEYRITATNDLGVSGAVATLTINDSDPLTAPTLTAPAGSPFTFATNKAITPIDFAPGGGGLGICTVSQPLPAGLRFDPSTCQISGTPRVALVMTRYTIAATNKTSPDATADVFITVTDTATPSLEQMVALDLTMNSNVGLPFAIANTGGSPTSCIPAPTTVGGDDLDSYNLTVFVAGGTCVIDSLDGNGPSRVLDGGSFTITPSRGATTTLTLNLRSPITPQIVAGNDRTYAINSARQLFGWGNNFENRLGLGDLKDFLNPVSAPALLTGNDWAQVSVGRRHTCAINASGQLWCWGNNLFGRLGLGDIDNANTPTQVGMASNWVQVSANSNHTCAIKAPGQLWCWGNGANGQLGLGNNSNTDTPTQVGEAEDWMQVNAGATHTCAIKASGQLWCWGYGGGGQLGLGNNINTNTPGKVSGADDWMQVGVGESHTCAIKAPGQLFCWGFGKSGQLGLGNDDGANTPVRVGDADNWMQVSSGNEHTCSINVLGRLFCWGVGANGRLGLGNIDNDDNDVIDNANTPTRVGEAEDWMQVGSGNEHTCSIKTSGQLLCWGNGANGQLGLGSNTSANTPTRVPGILLQ